MKGNVDYYANTARIISQIFLKRVKKLGAVLTRKSITDIQHWRLKSFISVMRHADRTPKQKVKYAFDAEPLLDLVRNESDEILLKSSSEFTAVKDAIEVAIRDGKGDVDSLKQISHIIDSKRDLDGTKLQLRPLIDKTTKKLVKMQSI